MAGPEILLVAAAVQAVGQISAGNAQAKSYKAQAQAYDYNAKVQRDNAARVAMEYSLREDQERRRQAIYLGKQRGAIAESNIGFAGTALDLEEQSLINAEMDNLTLRYEGSTQRTALLNDAQLDEFNAGVSRMNAKQARRQGYMNALGTILGGAGRYYSSTSGVSNSAAPAGPVTTTAGPLPWQRAGSTRPYYMGGGTY